MMRHAYVYEAEGEGAFAYRSTDTTPNNGCGFGLKPHQENRGASERGIDQLQRMRPERRQDVDLFGAVVHRVKRPLA